LLVPALTSHPDRALHKQKAGAPIEDPGPSLFTGLPTRWRLGCPVVLGRARRHPFDLDGALSQQGTELDRKFFCRSSRARRDRSSQVSSPRLLHLGSFLDVTKSPSNGVVGTLLPCLCCWSGAGGVGTRSEYPSKRVATCLVELCRRRANLPLAPVLTHKHPQG
jgi:hypothetical protein